MLLLPEMLNSVRFQLMAEELSFEVLSPHIFQSSSVSREYATDRFCLLPGQSLSSHFGQFWEISKLYSILLYHSLSILFKSTGRRVCVAGGNQGVRSSVCLGGLAHRSHLVSTLVTSESVISGLPRSSMPVCTLQFPLLQRLQESSTAVAQVCCGTVIWSCPSRLSLSRYSPSPINKDPAPLYQRAPLSCLRP